MGYIIGNICSLVAIANKIRDIVLSDKFVINLSVPRAFYGSSRGISVFFAPTVIHKWLVANKLKYEYVGSNQADDSCTTNIGNAEYTYMIRSAQETDAVALALQFPSCKVKLIEKYGYE